MWQSEDNCGWHPCSSSTCLQSSLSQTPQWLFQKDSSDSRYYPTLIRHHLVICLFKPCSQGSSQRMNERINLALSTFDSWPVQLSVCRSEAWSNRTLHILIVLHVRDFLPGLVPPRIKTRPCCGLTNAHTMFPQWIISCGMTHLRNSDIFIACRGLQHNIGKIPEGMDKSWWAAACKDNFTVLPQKRQYQCQYLILCDQKLHCWKWNKIRNVCRLPVSSEWSPSPSLRNLTYSLSYSAVSFPSYLLVTWQLSIQFINFSHICLLWR